ncbi:hypothetical protein BCR41DRAFT_426832 [Lobosporangium transversale]|uniref:F-box domain-containing protein n=1 Tax=Lobosporangium transversale TaxID=64571 RepID=A0A1Y2G5N7_9FUNG|nr:hypothetical protein BCR41DRAFT_426832 [Lobosporangium transversale]ORY95969.1 hypothetical protein BCR41DRAFT_426832 [Lobosporangium transversale]|eukprot:XP_021875410.1 hypothetical protein BCR41DRAFT_426832 [Lobosporangium transversale]
MDSIKLNPFEIPEIILLIGRHLDQDALLCCIRISKIFHNTLVGLIWRFIVVESYSRTGLRYPNGKPLQHNKKYIEELVFYNHFPDEFMSLQGCDRLRFIKCVASGSFNLHQVFNLVKNHRATISTLKLHCSTLREIWAALLECTHLEHLTISKTYINPLSLGKSLAGEQKIVDGEYIVAKSKEKKLCDTAEALRVNKKYLSTHSIAQAILPNCPHLEELWGSRVSVIEVANSAE